MTDLFGVNGRAWLAAQPLPVDEAETVSACLRQVDFLEGEIELIDRRIAEQVMGSPEIRRLMSLPGFGAVSATALMAAIGDIDRFPCPRHLVGYLGLDPKVVQSGSEPRPPRADLQARSWLCPPRPGRGRASRPPDAPGR